jgi:hypothetical protein
MTTGRRPVAVVLDLSPPACSPDHLLTRPCADEPYPHLDRASDLAGNLRGVLEEFGYEVRPRPGERCRDGADVDRIVRDVLSPVSQERSVIVHALGHARWLPPRAKGDRSLLLLLDPRLRPLPHAVDTWVRDAAKIAEGSETLLVLDCSDAGHMSDLAEKLLPGNQPRRHWVMAACPAGHQAYDGHLTQALIGVLRKALDGKLDLADSVEHLDLALLFEKVNEEVQALAARDGCRQRIEPIAVDGPWQRPAATFFPLQRRSPSRVPRLLADSDPAVRRLLDSVIDLEHFVGRITPSWRDQPGLPHLVFCGRTELMATLRGWAAGRGPALQVVTGRPGTGKSAVLAVVVCSGLDNVPAKLRTSLAGPEQSPRTIEGLAVVHARNQEFEVVTRALAHQWHLDDAGRPDGWNVGDLIAALRERPGQPRLVLDALDEALNPADLLTTLVLPLATAVRDDGQPVCRVLVGMRPQPRFRRLSDLARAQGGWHDLDATSAQARGMLRRDLEAYLTLILAAEAPSGSGDEQDGLPGQIPAGVRAEFARALAAGLTPTRRTDAVGAPACGEFLLATLHARSLLRLPDPPASPDKARTLVADLLSLDLLGILDHDLRMHEGPGHDWARPVAALLAHAEGAGLPSSMLAALLTQPPLSGRPDLPTSQDIDTALEDLRFYLRYDAEPDGLRLYRLFHADLEAALQRDPLGRTRHTPGAGAP